MKTKFGKPVAAYLTQKKSIFVENKQHMKSQELYREVYLAQPQRTHCMCCGGPLNDVSFVSRNIPYFICSQCQHLNGGHQDTDAFCDLVYKNDDGVSYGETYREENRENYNARVDSIYLPKANFLLEALSFVAENPLEMAVSDVGAGSGYFIAALNKQGIKKSMGYEISLSQVDFGNKILGRKQLAIMDSLSAIKKTKSEVVSMIGVLEHLQNPRDILTAIRDNHSIRFVYLSLPLFSPSTFFEIALPQIEPRQIAIPHTHLYTEKSLAWLLREFNFALIADWWFGSDMIDLMRSISLALDSNSETKAMVKMWQDFMLPIMDSLQLEFDKKKFSSEVHLVLEVIR